MTARVIDGRSYAKEIRDSLKQKIRDKGITPSLAVILIGDDPASAIYVERKRKACDDVGIKGFVYTLPADTSADHVTSLIDTLNDNPDISGILLQLPLPDHLDSHTLINRIAPAKDVDGLTMENMGALVGGYPRLVPCTPQGVLHMLKAEIAELDGKHAVIIGRSLLFGKPMGQLLLTENCTVTQCHSHTRDLPAFTRQADILIAATGRPHMVKADWVKDGAIVIDVGISRNDAGAVCGDVDFESVRTKAAAITPVPGGVGPMTVACLLANTVKAAER